MKKENIMKRREEKNIMIRWREDGGWHYMALGSHKELESVASEVDNWEYVACTVDRYPHQVSGRCS